MSIAPVFVSPTSENIKAIKRALHERFPDVKSAHMTEALAASFGKRTHAALLADLAEAGRARRFVALDEGAFASRLKTLSGHGFESPKKGGLFHHLTYPEGFRPIHTWSPGFGEMTFKTKRQRAWRAMMVSAINAGVEQDAFSMSPGDNRWPGGDRTDGASRASHIYRFDVDGIPAVASVKDAGWDELRFHVVFWPTAGVEEWIDVIGDHFRAGDACADGWLERRDGAYLQVSSAGPLHCRQARLDSLVAIKVEPLCYADRGSFRL